MMNDDLIPSAAPEPVPTDPVIALPPEPDSTPMPEPDPTPVLEVISVDELLNRLTQGTSRPPRNPAGMIRPPKNPARRNPVSLLKVIRAKRWRIFPLSILIRWLSLWSR